MSIKLIVEILDHAPGDLTPQDRLLLIALAEFANEETRECWPGWERIAQRMRWTGHQDGGKNAVSAAFARLAKRGIELRVAIGKTKKGHAVYAAHGHQTRYRIPPLQKGGSEHHP